jgi:hypothetical protein
MKKIDIVLFINLGFYIGVLFGAMMGRLNMDLVWRKKVLGALKECDRFPKEYPKGYYWLGYWHGIRHVDTGKPGDDLEVESLIREIN